MTPQRPLSASPQDIEFLSKVAAYWKSKEPQQNSTTQFGRFVVKETLGQGGFGIVYRAFDPLLGRDVAIKVPGLLSLQDEARLKRFLAEAKHLGSISHRNIAEIYEANEVDGLCYIAMKYYPAGTLADWLKLQASPIPAQIVTSIFEGVVAGVAAAHAVGIVHRDLKPSNILITSHAHEIVPCVADFGLAKNHVADDQSHSLAHSVRLGTLDYMAPERFADPPEATPAGDVYALGVMLFELLVGRKPVLYNSIAKPTSQDLVGEVAWEQQLQEEMESLRSTRPDASGALAQIAAKCLKYNSSERYLDAGELLVELQAAPQAQPARRMPADRGIKRFALVAAAVAALAATLWSAAKYWPANIESSPSPLVNAQVTQTENKYSYALEIQAAFARSKSDSAHARRLAVDRALNILQANDMPFEAAYLYSLGDSHREFTLDFGRPHWIPKATISQDGKWLAVPGLKQDVVLFDLDQPHSVRRYQGFQVGAFRIAISPNNQYVVGIDSIYKQPNRSAPQVLLWDFESSQLLLDLNVHLGLVNIITCEFISDDQLLVSGTFRDGDLVKIFSIVDGTVRHSSPLASLPSDEGIAEENLHFVVSETTRSATQTPKLTVVDKRDQSKSSYQLQHDAVALAISPSGLVALVDSPAESSSGAQPGVMEHQIVVWNPRTQTELYRESRMDANSINAIAFSPDEKSFFTIDMQGLVRQRVLDQLSLERSSEGLTPQEIWSVNVHPVQPKLLYGGDGGWVGLHDLHASQTSQKSPAQTLTSRWPLHGDMLVTQCAWRPGHPDQFATASFDGTVRLWRLTPDAQDAHDAPEKLAEFAHPARVRCIAFTADGARLATGGEDQHIRIFDLDASELITTLVRHTAKVRSLAYSSDGKQLFSCANDSTIITWDLSGGTHRNVMHLSVNSICSAVSPDGRWFVFGNEAGTLGIRSLVDESDTKDISVSKQWLRCLAISSDSQTLATGTQDGDIALWHLQTGIKLADFAKQSSPVMSLAFSADNRTLTAGLYSGQLIVWQASTDTPEEASR